MTRKFLISKNYPYEVADGPKGSPFKIKRMADVLMADIESIENNTKMEEIWKRLPVDQLPQIIDETITGLIRIRCYEEAMLLICINRNTMLRWTKWYYLKWNEEDSEELIYFMGRVSDAMALVRSLYSEYKDKAWHRGWIPTIAVNTLEDWDTYAVEPSDAIKRKWSKTHKMSKETFVQVFWSTSDMQISGFDKNATECAYRGNRLCDCVLMEGKYEEGVYHADKVEEQGMFVRLESEGGDTLNGWADRLWQWERVAEWIYLSMEGTVLYLEKVHTESEVERTMVKVLCQD
jgi:hypothetical protein